MDFPDNINYICSSNSFVVFTLISVYILVCCGYFYGIYRNISEVHNGLVSYPNASTNQQMLQWLGYSSGESISTLRDWHELIRRVTLHVSTVTTNHELKLIPSWDALTQHWFRANYVMKLAYSAPDTGCPTLFTHESFGWKQSTCRSVIEVVWDISPSGHLGRALKCDARQAVVHKL